MAGKIIADQIEHSTAGSLDTSYVVNGSAKSWVSFDADGSGIPIFDSFNISSTSDVDTGIYVVYFSNSFANTNYALSNANAGNAGSGCVFTTHYNTHTTGGTGVKNLRAYDDARVDTVIGNIIVHGDLA
jgi:hypothetical protein